ncbi:MAG: CRTAC1 family protein, partial [Verrucomicrobiae bacterium]|nr:CRTAC1 family protein [Verrucomicrobiae bacterium]
VDGDGDADLVLACEWGPVRVLLNDRGRLADATRRLGLEACTGWWNSVTTGDFDGDGRLDIVAGNFGRNTKYERHRQQPLHVYYGDLNENGIVEVIESHYDPPLGAFVPERQLDALSVPLPFLRERFSTHRAFASAAIEKVLGEQLAAARTWEVNWLESTLFLNRGDRFEPRALPVEAQLAPVFGIAVGDADGDGAEDLFLAQNFFPTSAGTPRYDAGRGLWLLGDGRGGFRPLGAERSGIAIYGEQRGAAVADYDADGRLDLVVTQNGAATRLFHNRGARPGLRVSIEGHPENPHGVGATLRLRFKDHPGPVREIHAGSGYWSQDGSTQVFGVPEPPVAIEVHWPDGSRTETAVAHGVRSLAVGHPGAKADGGG